MGAAVSETLQRLVSTLDQTAARSRNSGQLLQKGESTLAEVQENLGRMSELIEKAVSGDSPDRAALQAELDELCKALDLVLSNASTGDDALFLDASANDDVAQLYEDLADELETLFSKLSGSAIEGSASENETQSLPAWLQRGLAAFGTEGILASFCLDKNASVEQLMKEVSLRSLENSAALARLATMYLGAAIAGSGDASKATDMTAIMRGLEQLMEKLAEGISLDQAINDLTNGCFESLADFENQFTAGDAPNLKDFLAQLLLSPTADLNALMAQNNSALALDLLTGLGDLDLDLLMGVMSTLPTPEMSAEEAAANIQSEQLGGLQVSGRDLSGVTYDVSANVITVDGSSDVVISFVPQGAQANAEQSSTVSVQSAQTNQIPQTGSNAQASTVQQTAQASQTGNSAHPVQTPGPEIVVRGNGNITLQDIDAARLTINSSDAHIITNGENVLDAIVLKRGSTATFAGSGILDIGALKGDRTNTLVMKEGAVIVDGGKGDIGNISVWFEGPASFAAHMSNVRSPEGAQLKAFDVIWKTLVPGFSRITAVNIDGHNAKMSLFNRRENPDAVRFWLDTSHGHPLAHRVVVYGRDKAGQARTRYAFLKWEEVTKRFQEIEMYPNPFVVTGGEEGRDWEYDEPTCTLKLLTAEVSKLSGGAGLDANQEWFSGKIALSNNIGAVELRLAGVECRVNSGKAFDLARENNVTLILIPGSENHFESGRGCAGISIGDGSNLVIEGPPCAPDAEVKLPCGALTAEGGIGGAGIGRDSAGSWDRTSSISISGGTITAIGKGSGAGIGAGRHGAMGGITITGGTITSTGGKTGGAGIGAAYGAPVRDIKISGGEVYAKAMYHAAAIGAGVQGECGDIIISGTSKIRAEGGDPGADVGACLFGKCGKIVIAQTADVGESRVKQWKGSGLQLDIGSEKLELPRFCLSSKALLLNRVSLSSTESALAGKRTLNAANRRVSRIREAYNALCNQLEQNISRLGDANEYIHEVEKSLVRDTKTASKLLGDAKHTLVTDSERAMKSQRGKNSDDVLRLLRG